VWTLEMDLKAYQRYLRDMMELQMWYVVFVTRHEQKNFADAVNNLTEVYAYSDLYDQKILAKDNAEFQTLVDQLEKLWLKVGDCAFPAQAWKILSPHLEARMESDLAQARRKIQNSFAGFMYEFHPEYFGPDVPDFLTLHFRNYFAPDSPFNHTLELAKGLLRLINESRQARPDVTQVQCATWLNNIAPFQKLFPPEWMQRSNTCPLEGHTGWWGQFIDRTGQLHQKNVACFRQTGRFLYPNRHCRCGIDALETHLKTLI